MWVEVGGGEMLETMINPLTCWVMLEIQPLKHSVSDLQNEANSTCLTSYTIEGTSLVQCTGHAKTYFFLNIYIPLNDNNSKYLLRNYFVPGIILVTSNLILPIRK